MFVNFLNKMEICVFKRTLFVVFSNVSLKREYASQKEKEMIGLGGLWNYRISSGARAGEWAGGARGGGGGGGGAGGYGIIALARSILSEFRLLS